jgi:MFS family permease
MVFMIVGLPGLLIAALMFTIQEPKRRGLIQGLHGNVAAKKAIPFKEVLKFIGENKSFYIPMYLGLAVNGLILGGQQWIPEFFRRTYHMEITQIAYIQGVVAIVFSLVGLYFGTKIGEWFIKRGHADANLRLVVLANILSIPIAIIYPLMPNPWLAFTFLGINMMLRFLSPGAQNAALQSVTPNEMRGQVTAIFLFIFNLVGYGIGPFYIGAFTDLIGAESMLRYSLAASTAIAGPIATFILWRAMKPYGELYKKATAWTG